MYRRIPLSTINSIAELAILTHGLENKRYLIYRIWPVLQGLEANELCLNPLKLFIKSGLFDKNLIPNDFMIENHFVVSCNEIKDKYLPFRDETFCITCKGLDFLTRLVLKIISDALGNALSPFEIQITDGAVKTIL